MRRTIIGLVAVVGLCFSFQVAHAKGKAKHPDATVKLEGGSVAVGVGFSWGKGTLMYKGKSYAISADGFDVGDVGVSNITANGKVYNLSKLEDFNGNYTGVGAGATLAGGGGVLTVQNQNGVKIDLVSTTRGVKLTLAAAGVNLKLKQ